MTTLKLTRIDALTTRAEAPQIKLDEDIDNIFLGNRVLEIMEMINSHIERVSNSGIEPEAQLMIVQFIDRMSKIASKYQNRKDLLSTHAFRVAEGSLMQDIGSWEAEMAIERFLDERFGVDIPDTMRSPVST